MGRGISDKFARAGNDLITVDGHASIAAKIRQILLTRRGELAWDPGFGSDLHRLLHRGINSASVEQVKFVALRALQGLSDVSSIAVDATPDPANKQIIVRVTYTYKGDGRANTVVTGIPT